MNSHCTVFPAIALLCMAIIYSKAVSISNRFVLCHKYKIIITNFKETAEKNYIYFFGLR